MKLSIVVPCYNEEKNIPLILEKFSSVIHRDDVCVVLVENGSTDNSAEVIEKLLPSYPFAKVVVVKENLGYGFGILSGLRACESEFIGWTHADMQTDPADVLKALDIVESSKNPINTYVKGDRKGRPLFDQLFTIGMSIFESMFLRAKLWDINAQPNVFHKSFFDSWNETAPHDFSLDLFVLYQAKKKNVDLCRFPVRFPERLHGSSSWNDGLSAKWKFIKRTVEFSIKLKAGL